MLIRVTACIAAYWLQSVRQHKIRPTHLLHVLLPIREPLGTVFCAKETKADASLSRLIKGNGLLLINIGLQVAFNLLIVPPQLSLIVIAQGKLSVARRWDVLLIAVLSSLIYVGCCHLFFRCQGVKIVSTLRKLLLQELLGAFGLTRQ